MLATEHLGIGKVKAHNAWVATSSCLIKITNNITYGDDVLKVFEKRLPSNTTLFEVFIEVSKLFKCGPQNIQLLEGSNEIPSKFNGLTLE